VILIVVFQLPFVVLYALSPDDATPHFSDRAQIAEIQCYAVLVSAVFFAAAAAMTCLVRQAIYAAILSLAVVYLCLQAGSLGWFVAGELGIMERTRVWWQPESTGQLLSGFAFGFVTCTLIAWLAVRYDWGWASRD
jgi:hypothetical protein